MSAHTDAFNDATGQIRQVATGCPPRTLRSLLDGLGAVESAYINRVSELLAANNREVERRREAEIAAAAETEAGCRLRLQLYALRQHYDAMVTALLQTRAQHDNARAVLRLLLEALDRIETTAPHGDGHADAAHFLADAKALAAALADEPARGTPRPLELADA